MSGLFPNQLLSGPRGRRLLLELACARNQTLEELMYVNYVSELTAGDRARVVVELARATAQLEQSPPNEFELLLALRESTARAMYWQEPDSEDKLLAQPTIISALRPLAAILAPFSPSWWTSPMGAGQRRIQDAGGIDLNQNEAWQAGAGVRQWYQMAMAEERHSEDFIPDPRANYTGMWWSTPSHPSVPVTTQLIDGLGPVGLWTQEDQIQSEFAVTYPITLIGPCRVLEITNTQDYINLVERYPLRMTRSRLHDWYRVTGATDEWFIPHWGLIAKDYEAVHLTTAAYLETATRRLPVMGGSTMLAGWSPDVTYWVGNSAVLGGRAEEWQHQRGEATDHWLAA
ncbi:hypothetical protein [Timonella senegalensis]|uniref:hypothetical protein n=1 Tax=Timonella senegalensis TaxID=1465825 RepID=UPI000686A496|nr:hypothetical protein [Timonella senegalensis]